MIAIKNLSFDYKKNKPLFRNFTQHIESGNIIGLLGKNGAGKSTLLKLIAGLLKPASGELNVNGFIPFERNPNYLTDMYMIPEEFALPPVSISTYIKATSPLYNAFDNEKMNFILQKFELDKTDNLNKLSHGQRKKFLIAFALATNCKVLILDEPTNGLDIPSKSLFRKVLVDSISPQQMVLISTHQVKDIDTITDKIIVVENGKIMFEELFENLNKKYHFATVQSLEGIENILYSEAAPQGFRIITTYAGVDSSVDLELFFNAVIHKSI